MRRIPFVLGIVLLSLLFYSCPNTKVEKPQKRISAIPISIQFLNADSNSKVEPQKVTIGIYDRDSLVHTPIGNQSSSYTIENGFLSLVIRGNKNPNHEKEIPITLPYRFTMKISSNGYLEKTQTIVIDEYQDVYVPVFMMPLDEMPAGTSQVSQIKPSGFLGDDAVTREDIKAITTPSLKSGKNGISATLYIDKGTQLYGACKEHEEYENCKEQCKKHPITDPSGELKIDLYQFDPRSEASSNAFPNGFLVTDAVDNQGETRANLQNSFFFSSLGYFNLSMNVGKEKVKGFSQPVFMEMEVPSDLIDPSTGKPIEPNSKVPVWSLNETTGQWTNEDNLALYEDGEKLFAKLKMTHLSTWNLDYELEQCSLPPVTINIDNNPGSFKARYAGLFQNPTSVDPFEIGGNTNNILLLKGNKVHTLKIKRVPTGTGTDGTAGTAIVPLQFRLYNSVRKTGSTYTEGSVEICGDIVDIPLAVVGDDSGCVTFKIKINCVSHGTFLPKVVGLWYEKDNISGDPDDINYQYWNYVGSITDGTIEIDMNDIDIPPSPGEGTNYIYGFEIQLAPSLKYTFTIQYDQVGKIWEAGPAPSANVESVTEAMPDAESSCLKKYIIVLRDVSCSNPCDNLALTPENLGDCSM